MWLFKTKRPELGTKEWRDEFDKSFAIHQWMMRIAMIVVVVGFVSVIGAALFGVSNSEKLSDGNGVGMKDLFGFGTNTVNIGFNGVVESRCIDGYKFTVDNQGFTRQMIGANGGGIPCGK